MLRMPSKIGSLVVLCVALASSAGCQSDAEYGACGGAVLFGRPNDMTGLTDAQCQPRCRCGGRTFEPPDYTADDVAALLTFELTNPPDEITSNPYSGVAPAPADPSLVCGVVLEGGTSKRYSVMTYTSEQAARDAGARPTHFGPCGACSSLQDLSVYMAQNDLTDPVRQCGLTYFAGPPSAHIQCLQDLGFTLPCAQIWYYNTLNTKAVCSTPCYATLTDPYHLPDGTLNECLICDEEMSGPVFKAIAGRTRRNTGLPNAMCRPCSEVQPLVHDYE